MLEVKGVCFQYGKRRVLEDISFSVRKGEVCSLLGPNGVGKTTLLRCILGINRPQGGAVLWEGRDIAALSVRERARCMAYVAQSSGLTFPYKVAEVVLMGRVPHLGFGGAPTRQDRLEAARALSDLGIVPLAGKYFQQLSCGEKQLAVTARALAQRADLLVLDEPAAGLDFSNQTKILQMIRSLSAQGYTVVMTTHSPDHALAVSDAAVMLKDGRVSARGRPDEVVTGHRLSELYGIPAVVTETRVRAGGKYVKICIPVPDADEAVS
jgi:iron complex transport system ATP-binding protein